MDDDLYVSAIDPGVMNGFAMAHIAPDGVLTWKHTKQFGGGADGLKNFIKHEQPLDAQWSTKIAEKFIPFGLKNANYTAASLEPLRGEGVLIALDWMPDYKPGERRWQRADKQYIQGGKTKAEKRKNAKTFLKEHGWYITGKDVGQKDAEDAISARLHIITYVAQTALHRPFWTRYFTLED